MIDEKLQSEYGLDVKTIKDLKSRITINKNIANNEMEFGIFCPADRSVIFGDPQDPDFNPNALFIGLNIRQIPRTSIIGEGPIWPLDRAEDSYWDRYWEARDLIVVMLYEDSYYKVVCNAPNSQGMTFNRIKIQGEIKLVKLDWVSSVLEVHKRILRRMKMNNEVIAIQLVIHEFLESIGN